MDKKYSRKGELSEEQKLSDKFMFFLVPTENKEDIKKLSILSNISSSIQDVEINLGSEGKRYKYLSIPVTLRSVFQLSNFIE